MSSSTNDVVDLIGKLLGAKTKVIILDWNKKK